jgi:hypothetical protein
MEKKMMMPEFFIVGAPKCGTTAMQEYLRQHPNIFMPDMKEINHFADDLLKQDDPWLSRERIERKLLHSEVVKFREQVKRYLDTFGRNNVHVIIYYAKLNTQYVSRQPMSPELRR